MRRFPFILLLAIGCVTGTGGLHITPPESAVRVPLREKVVPFVEKLLTRDGWSGAVASVRTSGIVAPNAAEGWSEDTFTLDVTARTPAGVPLLIPVADYTPMLESLRRRLRDLVEDHGGGQVDWQILEGHKERTLVFKYKVGDVAGTVRVRAAPLADHPDELTTRIEFTVREQ